MQIPYLARHCRVVTFDGRGNGRSDRPPEASAYRERGVRGRRARGARCDREPSEAVLVSAVARRRAVAAFGRGASGAGRQAGVHRTGTAAAAGPRVRRRAGVQRAARRVRGLGEVEPPLLARRLRGLPRVLLLAVFHRAALDEAARGLRRLGARDRRRDAGRDAARAAPGRGGRSRDSARASAVRCWSSTEATTPSGRARLAPRLAGAAGGSS